MFKQNKNAKCHYKMHTLYDVMHSEYIIMYIQYARLTGYYYTYLTICRSFALYL